MAGLWDWYLSVYLWEQIVIGLFLAYGILCFWVGIGGADNRTSEQRLMETTISDNVTRVGAVLDAVNAEARGRKPKSSF